MVTRRVWRMDISIFDYAPLYIPTDLRKLISFFSSPLYVYLGCIIEDRDYVRVLGACRTLVQAEKICLIDKARKIQSNPSRYHILKVEEGDVLSDKIYSRLLYPPQIHSMTSIVYRPPPESSASLRSQRPMYFNTTCSFCMEKFERGAPVTRLPCNHLFHFEEIWIWLLNSLNCPLCRKIVRNDPPSLLEAGEMVYIDEGDPYVTGVGGPRSLTLSLSKSSQRNLDYYALIEQKWKIRLHPKGGGVPQPYKFFVQ